MNSSFSKVIPKLQLAWDSTSLGVFKSCPRRYQYSIIEGWTSPGINFHLRFGLEFHSALELYEHERAAGATHEQATIIAVRYALNSTWDYEINQPWITYDSNKNRETLIRSIILYLNKFENDPLKTFILANNKAAVELSFRLELDKKSTISSIECPSCGGTGELPVNMIDLFSLSDKTEFISEICENCGGTGEIPETYLLCGHFDKVASAEFSEDDLWIPDKKTTKKTLNNAYFAQYSPDNQVSFYSYSGKLVFSREIHGVIIDAAQIMVNTTEFRRMSIERRDSILSEWINDTLYYISLAEVAAERDYWPQNDKACGSVFEDPDTGELSYGCSFRGVCAAIPEARQEILENFFKKRVWDPLQTREHNGNNGNETEGLHT